MPILSAFPGFYPLLELGVFFIVINYIYLGFMQIHAIFYFNYIIYSGLLIFCCQNVATNMQHNILNICDYNNSRANYCKWKIKPQFCFRKNATTITIFFIIKFLHRCHQGKINIILIPLPHFII